MIRIICISVVLLSGCSLFNKEEEKVPTNAGSSLVGNAQMQNSKGEIIGEILLEETENGVDLTTLLNSLPPGEHGIHIHEVGVCEGPSFESSGAHWNPTNKKHGVENPEGSHLGDLPNLKVDDDGSAELIFKVPGITLKHSVENSLFDANGSSIIIHEMKDDYKTDPSGNSGSRIACGVIK